MKIVRPLSLLLAFCFIISCSSSDDAVADDPTDDVVVGDDNNDDDQTDDDQTDDQTDDGTDDQTDDGTDDQTDDGTDDGTDDQTDDGTDDQTSSLTERFVFDSKIVIENSYNTGGCDSPPCDTNDETLVGIFDGDAVPDDPYFYLSEDESELNLLCQLDKGRRIEFKQKSEGPLTTFAKIELEGVYYDIPSNGVTIAQVHNRGGSSNKPFFRLVLHEDGLETVVRKDPEVTSSATTFSKQEFSFVDNLDYDGSPLKITLSKDNGFVNIKVEQGEVVIVDESFQPEATTNWVTNTSIANAYYLKAGLYNDDGPHTEDLIVGYTTVVFESDDTDEI